MEIISKQIIFSIWITISTPQTCQQDNNLHRESDNLVEVFSKCLKLIKSKDVIMRKEICRETQATE